jgi:hypothetical protein
MKTECDVDPDEQFDAMESLCIKLAYMKLDGEYDLDCGHVTDEGYVMEHDDCHDTLTRMIKWAREIVGQPEERRSVYENE